MSESGPVLSFVGAPNYIYNIYNGMAPSAFEQMLPGKRMARLRGFKRYSRKRKKYMPMDFVITERIHPYSGQRIPMEPL